MGSALKVSSADAVKAAIARLVLPRFADSTTLGRIRLRPHQKDGVARIMTALDRYGGAILCDEVGLGKTFTAAAVARRFCSAVVIAPAGLLPMWHEALERAQLSATLISLEAFSRRAMEPCEADIVVMDEAHHFRNSDTIRFRNVAHYVGSSRLLLLTATPVHNRPRELDSLLSLFLGSRAKTLTSHELSECVIRRHAARAKIPGLPDRIHISDVCPPASVIIRQQILDLPPPVPVRDGDYCATLVQFTLLRQWASSDAALKAGLDARIAKAGALISALESGTYPTRKELAAWIIGGADVQLGFSALLADPGGDSELLNSVRVHERATTKLRASLERSGSTDQWRADYLRSLRSTYPDRKIIAFTQFASTAHSLFSRLSSSKELAVITASGGRIASGPASRKYIIDRFAPTGNHVTPPPARERISMLVTTDLCSEGLNLQDASVVVHLDTPWTPARLEQRVGRAARPGSAHSSVMIHTLATPDLAEDLLRLADRLRAKSAMADAVAFVPDAQEKLHVALESWHREPAVPMGGNVVVGLVGAERDCFVGVVGNATRKVLIGGDLESITTDPESILAQIESFSAADACGDDDVPAQIVDRITRWLEQQDLARSLGVENTSASARRMLTRRINQMTAALPTHSRVAASLLADRARRAVAMDYNVGAEERLALFAKSHEQNDAWLRDISSMEKRAHKTKAESSDGSGFQLLALLIGRKPEN